MTAKGLTRVTLIRMARPRGQPNLLGIGCGWWLGLALGSDLHGLLLKTGDAFGKSRGWLKKLRDASDKLRVATIAPRVDHRSTYQRSSEREE